MMLGLKLVAAELASAVPQAAGKETIGWTWPAYIILPLVAVALLYVIGMVKMKRRDARTRLWPIVCFALGWSSLLLALDSPIHELSEQLFWVHMTQHEILVLVSAPLLVLSRPLVPLLWAFPNVLRDELAGLSRWRVFKRVWLVLSAPFAAWLLHAAALWVWHAPALFIGTLHSDFIHAAQHISFLGSALLFWWALLDNHGGRLGYGGAVVYVFTTAVHTSVLGALLTFAPSVWYTPYLATSPAWNISALQDQQIGGLIMWVPAGALLTIIGLLFLVKWLQESQRRWEYTRTAEVMRTAGGGA
jgi:cytochrome c oxidase assembly factor CtaG